MHLRAHISPELLKEGEVLADLIVHQNDSVQHHLTSYRMYIAMVEEFAPSWFPDLLQRAEFLNNIYEKRGEVVELRLHGYDKTADILEREMLLINN